MYFLVDADADPPLSFVSLLENRNVYFLHEADDGELGVGTIISDGSVNIIAFAQTNDVSERRRLSLPAHNVVALVYPCT